MKPSALTRRERQIMDLLYSLESATATQIQQKMPDSPTYSTVRTQLRVLEEKGHVTHTEEGNRFVYSPKVSREKARKSALRHLADIFFDGSTANVVATLLGADAKVSNQELDRIAEILKQARRNNQGQTKGQAHPERKPERTKAPTKEGIAP